MLPLVQRQHDMEQSPDELATLQQRNQKLRERCAELADQQLQRRNELGGLLVKLMHSHTESVHAQLRELDSRGLNASIHVSRAAFCA